MHRLHASLREFFLRGFKCMQNKMDNRVVTLLHFFFFLSQLNFSISTDRNIFYPSKHIAEHLTCTVTDPTVLRPLKYPNVLTTEEQQIEASFISFKVSWLSLWKCSTHMQELKTGRFSQLINDLKCCFSCRNSINNNRNSFHQQHTLQKTFPSEVHLEIHTAALFLMSRLPGTANCHLLFSFLTPSPQARAFSHYPATH